MDHTIFHKDRLLMRSNLGCIKTATAVDTNVNDYTAGAHVADHFITYYYRGSSTLGSKCADCHLTCFKLLGQNAWFYDRCPHPLPDIILQTFQSVNAVVKNLN